MIPTNPDLPQPPPREFISIHHRSKAEKRAEREAAARAREAATGQKLREMEEQDPAALERALGMACYDLHVTGGRHPAAKALLRIAAAEGIW